MKKKRGLSFVEVMYAVLLLATTVIILSRMSSQSSVHLNRSKRYHLITQLMENQLNELELKYLQEGLIALKEIEREKFKEHPNFSWSLKIQSIPYFDLLGYNESLLKIPDQVQPMVQDLSEELQKLITEAQLTIHYQSKEKETNYSITSYFIDFKKIKNNEFLTPLLNKHPFMKQAFENGM